MSPTLPVQDQTARAIPPSRLTADEALGWLHGMDREECAEVRRLLRLAALVLGEEVAR